MQLERSGGARPVAGAGTHSEDVWSRSRRAKRIPRRSTRPEEAEYFGRKCLIARRLLERGVRFVQIWSGNDNGFPRRNWDSHEDIERDHGPLAYGMAVGTAALITDLKQRGLLDDTIILWTTEFGRMPSTQGSKGRDHNPYVFYQLAVRRRHSRRRDSRPVRRVGLQPAGPRQPDAGLRRACHDPASAGIDHTRLTVRHDGIDRRLTDVHGHVIKEILA